MRTSPEFHQSNRSMDAGYLRAPDGSCRGRDAKDSLADVKKR